MSYFQDLDETCLQQPWGSSPEEFRVVGVELRDRESLFYADYTQNFKEYIYWRLMAFFSSVYLCNLNSLRGGVASRFQPFKKVALK